MGVTKRVHEVSGFESGHLREHVREKGVAGDVERHAEEEVGAALIKLAAQSSVGRNVELKKRVAGRQGDLISLLGIPAGDEVTATGRIIFQLVDEALNLIDAIVVISAIGFTGCTEATPLMSVDGTEVALGATEFCTLFGGGPFIPNRDAVFVEPIVIRAAG